MQTLPSDYHSSSLTNVQESCTYNYSMTLQKVFLLKLIPSQANKRVDCDILCHPEFDHGVQQLKAIR